MEKLEKATLAAGCFWCVEAVFQRINGVKSVMSGYTGGKVHNPTYKDVCTGDTGHAEAIQITFDPNQVSYEQLLEIFWAAHNPTLLDRQGTDIGTQYRSAIFYNDEEQKKIAMKSKSNIQKNYTRFIVTEIRPLTEFYKAEDNHQNYYNNNKNGQYCKLVILPKLKKLKIE